MFRASFVFFLRRCGVAGVFLSFFFLFFFLLVAFFSFFSWFFFFSFFFRFSRGFFLGSGRPIRAIAMLSGFSFIVRVHFSPSCCHVLTPLPGLYLPGRPQGK